MHNEETGAVLTDLSNAFDYINHNLLIAKLNANGVENLLVHRKRSSLGNVKGLS